MRWIVLIILMFLGFIVQGQSWTVNVDTLTCRIDISNTVQSYHFLAEKTRYIDRNNNLILFDDRRSAGFTNEMITNYANFTLLKADLDSWFETCNVVSAPVVPPGLTALFANQKSIDFDGTAEYVSVPDADNLSMIDGGGNDKQFMMTGWYKMDDWTQAVLFQKYNGSAIEYNFGTTAGDLLALELYDGTLANYQLARTTATLTQYEGEWVHLACGYNGIGGATAKSGINLYINGVEQTVTTASSGTYVDMENTAANVSIGSNNGISVYADGKVDQCGIFKGSFFGTPALKEIMTIRDLSQFIAYDSLVLYQEYDSPDSTQANGIVDLSPAGNHGTMQSGEYTDLNLCVEWPYSYQLESNTTYSNLTPMQSSIESDSSYGGFGLTTNCAVAEYINFGDVNDLSNTDSVTFIAWVQLEDGCGSDYWLFSKIQSSGNFTGYGVFANHSAGSYRIQFAMYNDDSPSNKLEVRANEFLQEDQIVMVSVVYDGSQDQSGVQIYYNDRLISHTVLANTLSASPANAENFTIGARNNGSKGWNGFFYDPVMLHRAYSGTEIAQLYNSHAPVDYRTVGDSIIGWWPMYGSRVGSNTVIDFSDNGNNGSTVNSSAADLQYTYPREIFDADTAGSVDFDGSAEYISIADSDSLSFTDGAGTDQPFSTSSWIYVDADVQGFFIAKDSVANAEYQFRYYDVEDNILCLITDQTAANYIGRKTATNSIELNEWYHIVVSYDGSESSSGIDIYINGVPSDNADFNQGSYTGMTNTNTSLAIGARDNPASYLPFSGKISHTTIMNVELTLCQVQEIYNDGSPVDPRNWTFWSDDFIHYKLNQDEDLESTEGLTNISPNGSCNGTATNMTNAANKITTSFPTN